MKQDNERIPREELDHIHLPDPVLNDINELRKEYKALKEAFDTFTKNKLD